MENNNNNERIILPSSLYQILSFSVIKVKEIEIAVYWVCPFKHSPWRNDKVASLTL